MYKLRLKANGKFYHSKGKTMLEAVEKMGIIPIKTHGLMMMLHGEDLEYREKKVWATKGMGEKLMPMRMIKRNLGEYTTPTTRVVFAKNLSILIG